MHERPAAVLAELGRQNASPRGGEPKRKGPRYTRDGSTGAGGPTLLSTLRATLLYTFSRPRGLRVASLHRFDLGHYELALYPCVGGVGTRRRWKQDPPGACPAAEVCLETRQVPPPFLLSIMFSRSPPRRQRQSVH